MQQIILKKMYFILKEKLRILCPRLILVRSRYSGWIQIGMNLQNMNWKPFMTIWSKGGVLIIDDYGHWSGSKKAVDEFIKKRKLRIFLNRIDYTGRLAIKM